jgi:hypothetical protein
MSQGNYNFHIVCPESSNYVEENSSCEAVSCSVGQEISSFCEI